MKTRLDHSSTLMIICNAGTQRGLSKHVQTAVKPEPDRDQFFVPDIINHVVSFEAGQMITCMIFYNMKINKKISPI